MSGLLPEHVVLIDTLALERFVLINICAQFAETTEINYCLPLRTNTLAPDPKSYQAIRSKRLLGSGI
jgi:hypothetical protein